MIKRLFDVLSAFGGLVLLSPLFLIVAVWIKLDSAGPVFFTHQRVGKEFRPFGVYKFRTMVADAAQQGASITWDRDPRVTRVGRFLRRTKIDELPQLLNVLRGEMSIVGPRPEIGQYVELFREDYSAILQVRPGITDLASLKYPDEEMVLAATDDPTENYRQRILPHKIQLAKESVKRSSFFFDIVVIFKTLFSIANRRSRP